MAEPGLMARRLAAVLLEHEHGWISAEEARDLLAFEPQVSGGPLHLWQYIRSSAPRCECGTDKAGGGMHSSWCPKGKQ